MEELDKSGSDQKGHPERTFKILPTTPLYREDKFIERENIRHLNIYNVIVAQDAGRIKYEDTCKRAYESRKKRSYEKAWQRDYRRRLKR